MTVTEPHKPNSFTSLAKSNGASPLAKRSVQIGLFIGLATLLILVIFILPNWVGQDQPTTSADTKLTATGNSSSSSTATKESPWQDAQQAKIRRQAQDLLSKMLPLQDKLEEQQVLKWAKADYQAAIELAQQADINYKTQQYDVALEQYQAALTALENIQSRVADIYKQQLELGEQALTAEQAPAATAALTIASQLHTDTDRQQKAESLLQRAAVLDEVLDIIHKGDRFNKQQQWQNALGLYRQAIKLDPDSKRAQLALQQVKQSQTDDNFGAAMSQAYAALQEGQYPRATKYFKQALAVKPNASDAKAGLQQANEKIRQIAIGNKVGSGHNHSRQEQWQQAVNNYQGALSLDASSVQAKVGLIKARARLQLDQKLQQILQQKEKLQDSYQRQQTQTLLQQAAKVKPSGERLSGQISQLRVALIKASSPVPVTLTSDGLTQIHIYKVKRLQALQSTQLELTPGRYTAVGSRSGFRDARIEFSVAHGVDNSVEVICRERI